MLLDCPPIAGAVGTTLVITGEAKVVPKVKNPKPAPVKFELLIELPLTVPLNDEYVPANVTADAITLNPPNDD